MVRLLIAQLPKNRIAGSPSEGIIPTKYLAPITSHPSTDSSIILIRPHHRHADSTYSRYSMLHQPDRIRTWATRQHPIANHRSQQSLRTPAPNSQDIAITKHLPTYAAFSRLVSSRAAVPTLLLLIFQSGQRITNSHKWSSASTLQRPLSSSPLQRVQ